MLSYFKGSRTSLNPDEARHVNHWALIMRLFKAGFPYDVIVGMNDSEIAVVLSILIAIDKKREEDNR